MNSERSTKPWLAARGARGFTLIELLVTFAVVAVMLTLAAPSFLTLQRNSQLTSNANAFVAALTAARAEAMKRQLNTFVRPCPTCNNDFTQGWIVYADGNWDNAYTAGTSDVLLYQQGPMAGTPTVTTYVTTSDSISYYVEFSGAGFMFQVNGSLAPVQGLGLTNGTDTRLIIASPAGRFRVCKPTVGTVVGDPGCSVNTAL